MSSSAIAALEGHAGAVSQVVCAGIDGRPHALTAGFDDRAVKVFGLATMTWTACAVIGTLPHAVSTAPCGGVTVWTPAPPAR